MISEENIKENKDINLINLTDLINDIEELIHIQDKNTFIQKYNIINEQMQIVDEHLESVDDTATYDNLTINELFEIIEQYNNIDTFTVGEIKSLSYIINLLEQKLNQNDTYDKDDKKFEIIIENSVK